MSEFAVEDAARLHCDFLLKSSAARRFPEEAEALIILAFTIGSAWGLDRPDMIELAKAQHASLFEEQH